MQPGKPLRHALTHALAVTVAVFLVPTPTMALGAATRPSSGTLSPRLAELAKPAVRTAPPAEQARALSLTSEGPGSLVREGNRVLVEVRFDHGAAAGVDDLRQAGAEIVNVSRKYQTATVAAKPDELRALNGVPRVAGATEVLTPIAAKSSCPAGAALSEGVEQMRAAEARNAFGVTGEGVTVGILSDSFDKASEAADESGPVATHESDDVASGDLPGTGNTCSGQSAPVKVLDDSGSEGEDEGRAMGQIVHDLAPRAGLAFATAFTGETAFAENIERLAKPSGEGGAGAQVIADDVSYFGEPFFQEGPVGVAVSNVTEQGVAYFSAAGNDNLIHNGHDIASWEAPEFRDAGSCPTGTPSYATHCMDFDPGPEADNAFGVRVAPGATLRVDLQWDQPWHGVTTDLDAYLLSSSNTLLAKSENFNVATTQTPFEYLPWTNTTGTAQTVRIAIDRCDLVCGGASGGDSSSPRLKFALLENGPGQVTETEYEESSGGDTVGPTIFGHSGGKDVVSVGAIRYSASEAPETYSSRGPVAHDFGPVEGVTPALPLGSTEVLAKPDVTATDCVATTFFAFESSGKWRFCGTSAAAPHAAAVAALMHEADPSLSPAETRAALEASAGPIGSFGPAAVGAGLIDAVGALGEVTEPLSPEEQEEAKEEEAKEGEPGEGAAEEEEWSVIRENVVVPPLIAPEGTQTPTSTGITRLATPAPSTFFLRHPAAVVRIRGRRAHRIVFRFGTDQSGVTFLCKVDRQRFHRCAARFARRYRVGRHVLRVKALNSEGSIDKTPALYRFRVVPAPHRQLKRRHTRHHRR